MASNAAARRDEDGRILFGFVVMHNANHIFSQRFALSANRRDTSTPTCAFSLTPNATTRCASRAWTAFFHPVPQTAL